MQLAVFAKNDLSIKAEIIMDTNQEKMAVETQEGSDSSEILKQEEHCKQHMGSI